MECCSQNCKYLFRGYEFDTLGLYINFNDKSLWDARYAIDKWKQITKVITENVRVVFNYYPVKVCQKLGVYNILDNIRYLESLSPDRINFFTNVNSTKDDFIRMYNYLSMHKSLCIFYGNRFDEFKSEWEHYENCGKIPCIEILPKKYCKVFWNGIDDRSYEVLYSDEYEPNDDKMHIRHY